MTDSTVDILDFLAVYTAMIYIIVTKQVDLRQYKMPCAVYRYLQITTLYATSEVDYLASIIYIMQ
jgi:hypothetical protein